MCWSDRFDNLIAQKMPDLQVLRHESMAGHTTFRVGGPARRMAKPAGVDEMGRLLDLAQEHDWPCLVVGNGSNLLVRDGGLDLLVIHTGALTGLALEGETCIRSEAGLSMASLAVFAQKNGLTGLEFAHGIPGSVGGGICMNAGAYGGELCQVTEEVTVWLPEKGVCTFTAEEMAFSYRHSYLSDHPGVVLGAKFRLRHGDRAAIKACMEDLIRRRREKQPLEYPSAGSTFKRPLGHFAGALIEQCGLKGLQMGGARVSEKHAGFVINVGGATCGDILDLMEFVRKTVLRETGVLLEPEVKIVP